MTPEKCPGCGAKLEPEMLACPSCPMSFPENEPSYGVHPLRQTKAYAVLIPALFFAAIGIGVWSVAVGLFQLGEQNTVTQPAPPSSPPTPRAPMDPAPSRLSSSVSEEETSPEVASISAVSVIAPEQGKGPRMTKEWRLRGHVYDLTTLRPIPGCSLIFVDEKENRRIETRSSNNGSYRALVPSLPDRGYVVSVLKQGYSRAYLNPGTEGVAQMPASRRAELSRELSGTLSPTGYTVQAYDEQPLQTDFHLAPRP